MFAGCVYLDCRYLGTLDELVKALGEVEIHSDINREFILFLDNVDLVQNDQ